MHSQCYLKQPERIITKAAHPAHSHTYHRHTNIPRCLVCTSILEVLAHRVHQFHLSLLVASRPITLHLHASSFLKVVSGYGHLPISNSFLYHIDTLVRNIQGFLHKLHPKWFMVRSLRKVCPLPNHIPLSHNLLEACHHHNHLPASHSCSLLEAYHHHNHLPASHSRSLLEAWHHHNHLPASHSCSLLEACHHHNHLPASHSRSLLEAYHHHNHLPASHSRSLLEACHHHNHLPANHSHSLLEACHHHNHLPASHSCFLLQATPITSQIPASHSCHLQQSLFLPSHTPASHSHLACHLPSCVLASHPWRHILPSQVLLCNLSLRVVVHLSTSNLQGQHLQAYLHNHLRSLELVFHRDKKLTVRCKCPQLAPNLSLLFLLSLNLSHLLRATPLLLL